VWGMLITKLTITLIKVKLDVIKERGSF